MTRPHSMALASISDQGILFEHDFFSTLLKGNAVIHDYTIEDKVLIGMGAIYAGVPAKKVEQLDPKKFADMKERTAKNYLTYAGWFEE